jgi:SPP1 family phage portal protein
MVSRQQIEALVSANTQQRAEMQEATHYYRCENTAIMKRRKAIARRDDNGTIVQYDDIYSSNFKEASGYLKLLIDQKVNYSINARMQCDVDGVNIDDIWGRKWRTDLRKFAKEASIKGFSVVQFYLQKGVTKWRLIPAEQCTPLYDNNNEYLIAMIRQYQQGTEDGKTKNVMEYWTAETVSKWEQTTGAEWAPVLTDVPHITVSTHYGDTRAGQEQQSWGVVPFLVLRNNDEFLSDLHFVKTKIDAYDVTASDYSNDLIENGSPYWVVKNGAGTSLKDWNKFKEGFIATRMVQTDDDGGMERHQNEVPHQARMEKMNRLEKEIFSFGMGVNTSSMSGSVTATEIMASYENLNLKAKEFEGHITDFLDDFVQFLRLGVNISYEAMEDAPCDITFVNQLVFDTNQAILNANQSKGMISELTRLTSDPRVADPEEEIKRMQAEAYMWEEPVNEQVE